MKMKILPVVLLMLLLCSCGAPVHKEVTPELRGQMMEDLKQGRMVLKNDLNATLYFIWFWERMTTAYNSQQWEQLTELVMQNGFASDITYYFLGVSAEQLGYPEAALKYYTTAINFYNDNNRDHHCREVLSAQGCPLNLARILPARADNVRKILAAEEQRRLAQEQAEANQLKTPKKIVKPQNTAGTKANAQKQPVAPAQATSSVAVPANLPIEPIINTSPGTGGKAPAQSAPQQAAPTQSAPQQVDKAPASGPAKADSPKPEEKKGGGLNDLAKDAL